MVVTTMVVIRFSHDAIASRSDASAKPPGTPG
jgi:hypothetical protein